MSQFLKVEITDQQINTLFADLPAATKRATANTLNKVVRLVNKNIRRFITDNYNIPKKSIKIAGGLVSFKRANARKNRGTATIFIRKVGRGMFKYGAVQGKTGTTVTIKKTPKFIRTAFISTWRRGDGQKRVFVTDKRLGKVTRIPSGIARSAFSSGISAQNFYMATKRRSLFGPKIADLYVSQRAGRVLEDTIDKEYQPLLDEEFNRQFEKRKR